MASSITIFKPLVVFRLLSAAACLLFAAAAIAGQRVALIAPDQAASSHRMRDELADRLSAISDLKILDSDVAAAAFSSTGAETPFNLTGEAARRLGPLIGCDFFILLRSADQRRSESGRADYFEAYAPIFVVSARTGRLMMWRLLRHEAGRSADAREGLMASVGQVSLGIAALIKETAIAERQGVSRINEMPTEDADAAANFRPPVPYRRIKPEYTAQAALYDVAATVDMVIELDSSGKIITTEITRWAGFGLDESVKKTVRAMNWRPAERNGKPLPMRFLVRYNFKKLEKQ